MQPVTPSIVISKAGSLSSRLLLHPLLLLLYFLSSVFANAANYFERLRSPPVMASTRVTSPSSSTTIQIYEEDDWVGNKGVFLPPSLAAFFKVSRPSSIVKTVDILRPPEAAFIAGPAPVDMQRGIGPILSQLPGEIRNMIYSHLLCNGHCQFLRASKALHEEGSALIAKNGVYRMGFTLGCLNKPNHRLPSQRIVDTIRNLDVHIDGGFQCHTPQTLGEMHDVWLLQAFGGLGRVRGRCNVLFEVHRATNALDLAVLSTLLRMLSDFETVVVRANIHWGDQFPSVNGPSNSLFVRAGAFWPRWNKIHPIPWSYFKWVYFYRTLSLQSSLGPGRVEIDRHGIRKIYHPRKALEEAEKTVACTD